MCFVIIEGDITLWCDQNGQVIRSWLGAFTMDNCNSHQEINSFRFCQLLGFFDPQRAVFSEHDGAAFSPGYDLGAGARLALAVIQQPLMESMQLLASQVEFLFGQAVIENEWVNN